MKNIAFRTLLTLIATISLACDRFEAVSSLPGFDRPLVPTAICTDAKNQVANLLKDEKAIWFVDNVFLADNSCAVEIVAHAAKLTGSAFASIRNEFGSFTSLLLPNGERVNIWLVEPVMMWLPVLDENGQVMDNTETLTECREVAAVLKIDFPGAATEVRQKQHRSGPTRHCYVDLIFKTDAEFKGFLKWENPHSFDEKLTQFNFKRDSGVISTIFIRPARQT